MNRILGAYCSRTGHTERLAQQIAARCQALADYHLVILDTPVWFWDVASPVRTWVRRHRRGLHRVALLEKALPDQL